MRRLFVCAIVSFVALPSLAVAEPRVYLGFNAGTLNPTEEGFLTESGLAFGASATATSGSWLGFGVSYLGSVNGETSFGEETSFQSGSLDLKLMAPVSNGQTGFTPYIRGGLGVYQFKADVFGVTSSTGVNAQIPIGAGFLIDLSPQVALGGDFAYHILFDANFDENPQRQEIDAWDATANLVFKL